MIIISTKICTYQLSIVSTITTKKENISWFIENKIEWLVCDVFAIFFFRILSSSRMKVISTHFFIPFRSCHTEFLFVLSSCGGGHEGYIPLIDFIVLCSQRAIFKARRRKWILGLFVYCLHIIKAIFHSYSAICQRVMWRLREFEYIVALGTVTGKSLRYFCS